MHSFSCKLEFQIFHNQCLIKTLISWLGVDFTNFRCTNRVMCDILNKKHVLIFKFLSWPVFHFNLIHRLRSVTYLSTVSQLFLQNSNQWNLLSVLVTAAQQQQRHLAIQRLQQSGRAVTANGQIVTSNGQILTAAGGQLVAARQLAPPPSLPPPPYPGPPPPYPGAIQPQQPQLPQQIPGVSYSRNILIIMLDSSYSYSNRVTGCWSVFENLK